MDLDFFFGGGKTSGSDVLVAAPLLVDNDGMAFTVFHGVRSEMTGHGIWDP
jgi:hypothetical protein